MSLSKNTIEVCSCTGELMSVERNKLCLGVSNTIDQSRFNISCRKKIINHLQSRINAMTKSDDARRGHRRQVDCAALNRIMLLASSRDH